MSDSFSTTSTKSYSERIKDSILWVLVWIALFIASFYVLYTNEWSIDLSKIAGQRPVITKFKKSISNFKTRKNTNAGLKVTLRKNLMYEFIDRLINIALPRIRDFRGLSANGFDQFGNYTLGIKEHIIFPEVNFDRVDKIRGLDITIVISSINKDHSYELLSKLNFPFIKKGDN